MMTTPLVGCGDQHLEPQSLLWTLIYQTLWIPVPGRLETFAQGKLLAHFVGMTLDLFQSRTLIRHRTQQQQQIQQRGLAAAAQSLDAMDVDPSQDSSATLAAKGAFMQGDGTPSLQQLERDAAVEPFRVVLDQRLKALGPIAQNRPGFEGFVQGMAQYREKHPPLSLPLSHQRSKR